MAVESRPGRRRPLMDVGIYALQAMRYLTGEEPCKFRRPVNDGYRQI